MPRRPTRYYPDYGPFLLTSGPDWRYQRAWFIVESGMKVSLRRDGPIIALLVRYVRAYLRSFMGRNDRKMERDHPHLIEAMTLGQENRLLLLEIHCRVLAGEPLRVIALKVGVSAEVLDAYCLAMFDVGWRLKQSSYIRLQVIGLHPGRSPTTEQLMMLSCYTHGPHTVDAWLDWWDVQGQLHDLSTPIGRQREGIEQFVSAQRLECTPEKLVKVADYIAMLRPKVTRQTARDVFRDYQTEIISGIDWTSESHTPADMNPADIDPSVARQKVHEKKRKEMAAAH